MIYIWIAIGAVFALAVGIGAFFIARRVIAVRRSRQIPPADRSEVERAIAVREVPPEEHLDESRLVEITDGKLLARIAGAVPGLMKAGNGVGNVAAHSGALYRAVLPAGAAGNGLRGADLAGQVSYVAVGQASVLAANALVSVMGVASMVVGQYYMLRITQELAEIGHEIGRISAFQNNEYRSRVFALAARLRQSVEFRIEIMQTRELRKAELAKADAMEQECIQLLGQAILAIATVAGEDAPDFRAYERATAEAQDWILYANALSGILREIADLRYALWAGAVSREQTTSLVPVYAQKVRQSLEQLAAWHGRQARRLGIDVSAGNRRRKGWDKFVHWLPALFNREKKFRAIPADMVAMIEAQTAGGGPTEREETDFFREDVELIQKDGKVYYLPPENKK